MVARASFVCRHCRNADGPLDERRGLDGYLSPEARRRCCLAGGRWPFDQAAHLRSFRGIKVRDELIRPVSREEGAKIAAWQATGPAAVADFRAAAGDTEFETDAVKVTTTAGRRGTEVAIFARRPRGAAVPTDHGADRRLPKPPARHAVAGIAAGVTFAAARRPPARRLGIDPDTRALTVSGGGADWIWSRAAERFPNAAGVLDVFHAAEHLSATTKALFGGGTERSPHLGARGTSLPVSDGYAGLTERLGEIAGQPRIGTAGAALGARVNYSAGHQQRLNYAVRLRRGQSIGSGMAEGAAKNRIGRRLKANHARWCEAKVNRLAGQCTALYSGTWGAHWQNN